VLGNRSTAVIHYAKDTIQHGGSTDQLAFNSCVMADALLADKSSMSYAARWLSCLSKGWAGVGGPTRPRGWREERVR
jgi:hypothetical protein